MRESIKLIAAAALGAALVHATVSARAGRPDLTPRSVAAVTADQLSAGFEHAAEVVRPSVVTIVSARHVKLAPDPFLEQLRELFGEAVVPDVGSRELVQQGIGSGVIVSSAGDVLTNYHVIRGAQELVVRLAGGRRVAATVVGADPRTDLAVLRLRGNGFAPAPLGDSSRLRVGEWVVAAGNPFGFTSTVTAGIVSARGRSRIGLAQREDFIQTDAAINPGNSGGPLVNLRGEVVGINTAIYSRTGGYMGIGFAIPINLAKSVMRNLG